MRYVPLRERMGVFFNEPEYWALDMRKALCFSHFIRGLGGLFGGGETLYLESVTPHPRVEAYLRERAAPHPTRLALGSSWPRPRTFHMALEPQALEGLFLLAQRHPIGDLCERLHVYRGNRVLLDGHDLLDMRCKISLQVEEGAVRKFCRKLDSRYRKETGPAPGGEVPHT